ncbi:DUF3014 domain-containing protein [Rhodanobacter sp. L36]|uniref:DUF3014 domain-containing protein n=1 Tax=Rhodanobacter sp. L36 TaxID=1747221 RepID=UPI00131B9A26|nr:DUF3014 domain-containing protein [Rhodanobacter sp. L36]
MGKKNSTGGWIVAGIVVLGVVAAGVYLARRGAQLGTSASPATAASSAATNVANPAPPPIQHPISQASVPASASTTALPALDDSDASVASALADLAGASDVHSLLISQQVIPRIVATIDSLPRRGLGTFMLPARTPRGNFIAINGPAGTLMSEQNIARYAPYMRIVENVDAKALVSWYVRSYPLFQDAYRQLGYPRGYFNDRLIVVIDNMLAAPDLDQPAALIPSKSSYAYVDPSLESLSAGQKLLLRVGPANEATLKAKLREIRAAIAGQALPAKHD